MEAERERERVIVRTSVVGMLVNIALAGFKAAVGLAANSIAVVLDAVNNLSDALSSVITLVGTKLAGRAPDKEHPLGHGRIEYLTALSVAGIIFYAGATSLVESVKKILNPEAADYSVTSLVIITVAIFVKIALSLYFKAQGKTSGSKALYASGQDAGFDAVISVSVLACALFYIATGIGLEAWVGALIALFIIRSGYEMMADTLNDILGARTDKALAEEIKRTVCEDPVVHGAYDLYLYNYGPEKTYGSVHVEVSDRLSANEIDAMERRLGLRVLEKHGVHLTGISIYSVNLGDGELAEMRRRVTERVMAHDYSLQVHGFSADREKRVMSFDVVVAFGHDRDLAEKEIRDEVESMYPGYHVIVRIDTDVS